MMRDLHHSVDAANTLLPKVAHNDSEGTGATVDLANYSAAELVVHVGLAGDTLSGSLYWQLKIQHGNQSDGSDAAAPASTDVVGGTIDANGVFATLDAMTKDEQVYRIGYLGNKRYIRFFADATGTHTNGTPMSAVVLRSRARREGGVPA